MRSKSSSRVPETPRLFHLTLADLAKGMGIAPAALRVFVDRRVITADDHGRFSLPAATAALALATAGDARRAAAQARAVGTAAERFADLLTAALQPVVTLGQDPSLPAEARDLVKRRCDEAIANLGAAAGTVVAATRAEADRHGD